MSNEILVEVQPAGGGGRQIGPEKKLFQSLSERSLDIEAAIKAGSEIAGHAISASEEGAGWGVQSVDLTFGISLAVEAGVVVSKASADASFEVKVTVARRKGAS